VEIALFRVLQESLTNVHRHSGASEASINFKYEDEAVILEVRDFGKGIPEERLRLLQGVSAETGVGLAGMRERLHELDGKLEIESDDCGTSMRATVPLCAMARPLRDGRLRATWRTGNDLPLSAKFIARTVQFGPAGPFFPRLCSIEKMNSSTEGR
jgi:signal transduction histidine kinase